jgi:DNA-binding MarR family transcriptional regulator
MIDTMVNTDLGALAAALTRRMIAEEEPILAAAGLSMWEYIVLARLGETSVESQSALAKSTRRDSTRLIAHLDRLESAGLLRRTVSPDDRRHHQIALTDAGSEVLHRVKHDIRAMEQRMLDTLPSARRKTLRADLEALSAGDDAPR